MAGKTKTAFICTECGAQSLKWVGRCPSCGAWNTMEEEIVTPAAPAAAVGGAPRRATAMKLTAVRQDTQQRYHTGLRELDRVRGGGTVREAFDAVART